MPDGARYLGLSLLRPARLAAAFQILLFAVPAAAQQPAGEAPAPAVVVETVERRAVAEPEELIARVEAIEAVDVRARVEGFLRTVSFAAGEAIEEGQLLFEIETEGYQAALASARAQLARAEATREEARRTLARTSELAQRGT